MDSHSKKHIIILNSKDRLQSSTSEYDADFKLPNDTHQSHHVQLKEVSFVNLMYNVYSKNNTLNYDFGGVQKSVTVPAGYYDINTLTTTLNGLQADLKFAPNNVTKKYDVTSASPSFILLTGTINTMIGFTTLQPASTSFSGNIPFNLIRTHYIHFASNSLAESDGVLASNDKRYAIIATLPVNLPYGFILQKSEEKDSADESVLSAHINMSSVNIRILDDNYEVVDNNGGNWVIALNLFRR